MLNGGLKAHYGLMTKEQRTRISLMSGKDSAGRPLKGHSHSYFFIYPDEHGQPYRLIVWRRSVPFNELEVEALRFVASKPMPWAGGLVYLVPLPVGTPLPQNLAGPARGWSSATPFVPARSRHRFRAGKIRPGETTERLAERLLADLGFPVPRCLTSRSVESVRLHQTRRARLASAAAKPVFGMAYNLDIEFTEPVEGPILIGDSSHFGLGLLCTVEDTF